MLHYPSGRHWKDSDKAGVVARPDWDGRNPNPFMRPAIASFSGPCSPDAPPSNSDPGDSVCTLSPMHPDFYKAKTFKSGQLDAKEMSQQEKGICYIRLTNGI